MAEEDFDDDDIHGETEGEVETTVQLGFACEDEKNPLFSDPNWREWDGGKIGGRPVWLDPVHLPSPTDLACTLCECPMTFVLQIYCPLDDIKDAFHRSLYVFVCRKKACVENGSVKCIRCQLPKLNEFYPFNPDESLVPPAAMGYVKSSLPKLCMVCGHRGPHSCSRCKQSSYCSREHQRSHWKFHKLHCGVDGMINETTNEDALLSLVLPEYCLDVSQEILCDRTNDALDETVLKANIWDNATEAEIDDDDDEDDDAGLTQTDYNQALGNEEADPLYTKFMDRIRRGGGDQVLRYSRWDDTEGPLQISSLTTTTTTTTINHQNDVKKSEPDDGSIHCCTYCGGPRKFEFQIMPQLLHYLKVDHKTKISSASRISHSMNMEQQSDNQSDSNQQPPLPVELESIVENKADEDIDWGTIDIFTCMGSCSVPVENISCDSSVYRNEGVRIQSPVAFTRSKKK